MTNHFWPKANPFFKCTYGAQYKSAIWTTSPQQAKEVAMMVADLEAKSRQKVLIDIEPAKPWWDAEEYHQQFMMKQRYNMAE